ncbi:MAG TPA: RagB/SusD family nutrient uptake outer membrane protein [Bacteroidales bacterium]|nr:RagB/SusD family nutrient uptake outer membrane protein [Bacteroidales bacterium]
MKKYLNKLALIFAVLILGFNTGCETLEVENLNQPDMRRVLASPDDVRGVVMSSFNSYWVAIKQYNIAMAAHVMADHTTASWGNFAWRDMSNEPRAAWNNDPAYGEADLSESVYYGLNAVISSVNDAIVLINGGMEIGLNGADNPMVLASAHLLRGLSLGQLGLSFDQAMVSKTEEAPGGDVAAYLAALQFQPWSEVIEEALEDLEKVVEIINANPAFTLPAGTVNGMTITSDYMRRLANSYAARFLTLGARTRAQNQTMNWTAKYTWADVLAFTNNGITVDFAPIGNGLPWDGGSWWDLNIKYLRQDGWGRVDMRIINMMDPSQPMRYPTDATGLPTVGTPPNGGVAVSADERLETDFQFIAGNNFIPGRGGWHFSHYRHSRYDMPPTTSTEGLFMGESVGPLRELRAYENLLMRAEAMVRTGNLTGAIAILNDPANPRKSRGDLLDLPGAAPADVILRAIFYERFIELFHNGYLISFCDTRRNDDLQFGSPLHWPVPGRELMALRMPVYTFGGWAAADGVNTSNQGRWIWPLYHFPPPAGL